MLNLYSEIETIHDLISMLLYPRILLQKDFFNVPSWTFVLLSLTRENTTDGSPDDVGEVPVT